MRAPGRPTATFQLPALTALDLRPQPVSGHLMRVARSSGDRWVGHWRDASGRQHKRVLGTVWGGRGRPGRGALTKQGAQQLLDEILVEARRTGPIAAGEAHDATFADAVADWLHYVEFDRQRRPTTLRDYRHICNRYLLPVFGELPLRAMTSELIDNYRVHLIERGEFKARTINKYLLVLHAVFRRAQRRYGVTVNPVAGIERQPVRHSGDFRVLSGEEVAALARVAHEDDAAVFTTAAFSGLRLGELRALRWRDVDFAKRIIHVRRSYTMGLEDSPKSGKVRAVPMIDQVARALDGLSRREQWVAVNDLVFPGPTGTFFEDSALRRRFYRALKDADIEHLRFHDLRHTFGTLAVQAFPLSDVKAYMGHADIATTMIYVHHVPQNDAADKLSRLLQAQAGPTSPAALERNLTEPRASTLGGRG